MVFIVFLVQVTGVSDLGFPYHIVCKNIVFFKSRSGLRQRELIVYSCCAVTQIMLLSITGRRMIGPVYWVCQMLQTSVWFCLFLIYMKLIEFIIFCYRRNPLPLTRISQTSAYLKCKINLFAS